MLRFLRNFVFGSSDTSASSQPKNVYKEFTPVNVDLPLPEDLIILILSYIDPGDLLRYCVYVKEWEPLIRSQSLWSLKCEREKKPIPRSRPNPLPDGFYQNLFFARFGDNLLKNPCGENSLDHWAHIDEENIDENFGENALNGWVVEKPPEGADEVPKTECQFCFATTYFWCRKGQLIDLWYEGFAPELLKSLKPKIYVGEWYCARFDCGAEYILNVRLLDEKKQILDSYSFYHKENQWTGRAWSHVEHEFVDYPASVRYIHFIHSGKDTQFWAGHYGSKMAEGEVILLFQESC